MFRIRLNCFFAVATLTASLVGQAAAQESDQQETAAAEPEFRLLRIAERWSMRSVSPVQFEEDNLLGGSAPEDIGDQGIQPVDSGPTQGFESFQLSQIPDNYGFSDWSLISKPQLGGDTGSLVDSASFVDELEAVQGTSAVALSEAPAVDIITSGTFHLTPTPDAAETLVDNASTQKIRARRRSPLGFDPRIRGFYTGQIYASLDGSYQFPVRSDLDGVFSKIDKALIGNVQVYGGPYTVRYGSGFAFLNVDTIPAPRYEDGWENHVRVGTNVRANGGQTYNTATVYGGGESMGYFANVGYRKGSDYESGDGLLVPSSYDAFNLFSGIGYDIDETTRSELRYMHIDEGNTEYAGQFFDVDGLKSDGLNHSLIHRDDCTGFAYRVDSWLNFTKFDGDTSNGSKRRADFPVLQRVDQALAGQFRPPNGPGSGPGFDPSRPFFGSVNGDLLSTGMRAGMTQEIDRDTTFGMGTDIRYVRQDINEFYDLNGFLNSSGMPMGTFTTGLPTAEVIEPGLYTEYSFATRDYIQTAVGARIAFAHSQANPNDVGANSNFRDAGTGAINQDLDVSDVLTSFFLTNDIDLAPGWSARLGAGYAERLPNLEQRYSDGLYLAIIQNGFSRLIGNPSLSKERNWQVDAQVSMESEYVRTRLSGFHSWIIDYVTYTVDEIDDPTGSRILNSINTDFATLTGLEYYAEADLSRRWQTFASLAYLEGRDREIDQPLGGITPLEARWGLRLLDTSPQNRWAVEWGLRAVDNQDRLGTYRTTGSSPSVTQLETETPGFVTSYIRGYYSPTDRVNIVMGAENIFNRDYYEHLNLRLPANGQFIDTVVKSPGFSPYFGVEVDY
ncbi:TonB-dependent receptor [Stieleria sp. TO1_6]|uniref:TonB-dependent receptor plug domain-containing protein n=1 Tax=Stieleria tagensis TaxID=2956795 RepID=UPI00209BAEF3|nr:TonB-dependent receptor [Stieleria tagensis]MCO8120129.1 TonB-dependent receptor [Stieleria tagensis]